MPSYEAGLEPMPLPEGAYEFSVIDANDKTSQSGNPMIELQLAIKGPNGDELRIFDHLVFVKSMTWKIDHFRTSTGEQVVKGPASLDAIDCIDRCGKALLTIERFGGRDQNKVSDYIDPAAEKKPPAKPSSVKPASAAPKTPSMKTAPETLEQELRRKGAEDDDIPMA
jgi:hypothetical protein